MKPLVLGLALLFAGPVPAASDYLKKGDKTKAPAVKSGSRAVSKDVRQGAGIIGPSDSKSARAARRPSSGVVAPIDSRAAKPQTPDRRIIGPSDAK